MNQEKKSPFIPQLTRQTSDTIAEIWSSMEHREYPAEYQHAVNMICLRDQWIPHTKIARYLREIDREFKADPAMKVLMQNRKIFEDSAAKLIAYGYRLEQVTEVGRVRDTLTNQPVHRMLMSLFDHIGWRRPYLTYAVTVLGDSTDSHDLIVAKMSEVCDRAHRCHSAKCQAFSILLSCSFHLRQVQSSSFVKSDHRSNFYDFFEMYLDDHKERAFNSSFIEPTRYYFDCIQDSFQRDHVNIHAINYYAALVHATLGFQLPMPPQYGDGDRHGVASFWEGLNDEAWYMFSDPLFFGRSFEGIPPLLHERRLGQRIPPLQMPVGEHVTTAKVLANNSIDPNPHAKVRKQRLALYVERFAHFFTRDFFLRKTFEALYSECKPEFSGAQKTLTALYAQYQEEKGLETVPHESLVEHVYTDDSFMEIDITRLGHFFSWLGVAKPIDAI